MTTTGAVIVAAGSGTRMAGSDKLFTEIAGRPLLAHTIAVFQNSAAIDRIVLVLAQPNLDHGRVLVKQFAFTKVAALCSGGPRRQDSVRLVLEALGECEYVAIHDGARPLVRPDLIERGLQAARETGAAIPAIALVDTVKEAAPDGTILRTLDRSRLWAVQTPQVFRYDLLLRAHREVTADVTDDAAMVEALGERVRLFEGSRTNFKLTTAEDFDYVRWVLSGRGPRGLNDPAHGSVEECPFCDYSDAGFTVYQDDEVFAIVDKQPINDYHLLVIPRRHCTSIGAMPDELLAHVMLVVKRLSSAVRAVAGPDAITYSSDDDLAGLGFNLVEHFKFHVIPRYRNDGVKVEWNRGPLPDSQSRARIAREVREALISREAPRTTPLCA